eukprot:COSAG01_NODE_8053_length_2938_cov_4.433956_3_plen_160_part_00
MRRLFLSRNIEAQRLRPAHGLSGVPTCETSAQYVWEHRDVGQPYAPDMPRTREARLPPQIGAITTNPRWYYDSRLHGKCTCRHGDSQIAHSRKDLIEAPCSPLASDRQRCGCPRRLNKVTLRSLARFTAASASCCFACQLCAAQRPPARACPPSSGYPP